MPEPKIVAAILCEMTRPELNNKVSIIGAYSGDVVVQSFPATFPLSSYFEVSEVDAGAHQLNIKMEAPGFRSEVSAELEVFGGGIAALPMPMMMLAVSEPGDLTIQIKFDDGEWHTALARKILQGPVVQ
ncbi:DUF6941 family protein [Sphingobium sp. YR657]|uniref:DUF6941 family protein n=1 Tax=Sphingobium sp. YR657 TaxID=1884366 RepID=UPI001587E51D|nr:hypothetical protein [Sphingobium sp. YR657]